MPTSRRLEVLGYLAGHVLTPQRARARLLRAAGVRVEGDLHVLSGLRVTGEGELTFGEGCFVNHDCVVDAAADVTLGRGVALGNRVALITSDHDFSNPWNRAGTRVLRPITIGDGAWIGAGATVLGGVTIGAGAVVAAGALVRRDVQAHTLWGGVPARQLKELPLGAATSDDSAAVHELLHVAGQLA